MSIGGNLQGAASYETHCFKVESGDAIILYTDGIVDQFGGLENKKYLTKRLVELIEKGKGIDNISAQFEQELMEWKGDEEQTDDMLLLAIEL